MINKKGGDRLLSLYWFAVLLIIAGGVVAMVYNFYGAPYDVRETEGKILADRVADCISYGGTLNSNIISSGEFNNNFDFEGDCGITLNTEDENNWKKIPQYFYEISFYDTNENILNSYSVGNANFRNDCFITDKKGKDYASLAKCYETRIYSVDDNNNQYLIKIITAVGKSEKNFKQ